MPQFKSQWLHKQRTQSQEAEEHSPVTFSPMPLNAWHGACPQFAHFPLNPACRASTIFLSSK